MPKESQAPKGKCEHCGGVLRAVGQSRARGRSHADWKERRLHKKCCKELKQREEGCGSQASMPFGRVWAPYTPYCRKTQ